MIVIVICDLLNFPYIASIERTNIIRTFYDQIWETQARYLVLHALSYPWAA